MAEINTGGGESKRGKPTRQNLRVDFTPMVDMNMLLITFFMFCTTLSKPQMMNLVMPNKETNQSVEDRAKVEDTKTLTLLLGGNDAVYYYFGKPNYEDYTSLQKTDYSPEGLRGVLVQHNGQVIRDIAELGRKKQDKEISDEQFTEQRRELRDAKGGQVVIIKPTDNSTYVNLVDVLDEMQICSIGRYAIVEVTEGDEFLMQNYLQQGALSGELAE